MNHYVPRCQRFNWSQKRQKQRTGYTESTPAPYILGFGKEIATQRGRANEELPSAKLRHYKVSSNGDPVPRYEFKVTFESTISEHRSNIVTSTSMLWNGSGIVTISKVRMLRLCMLYVPVTVGQISDSWPAETCGHGRQIYDARLRCVSKRKCP